MRTREKAREREKERERESQVRVCMCLCANFPRMTKYSEIKINQTLHIRRLHMTLLEVKFPYDPVCLSVGRSVIISQKGESFTSMLLSDYLFISNLLLCTTGKRKCLLRHTHMYIYYVLSITFFIHHLPFSFSATHRNSPSLSRKCMCRLCILGKKAGT